MPSGIVRSEDAESNLVREVSEMLAALWSCL